MEPDLGAAVSLVDFVGDTRLGAVVALAVDARGFDLRGAGHVVGLHDGGLALERSRHRPELDGDLALKSRLAGLAQKDRTRHAGHNLWHVLEENPNAMGGLVDVERRFDVRHSVVSRLGRARR